MIRTLDSPSMRSFLKEFNITAYGVKVLIYKTIIIIPLLLDLHFVMPWLERFGLTSDTHFLVFSWICKHVYAWTVIFKLCPLLTGYRFLFLSEFSKCCNLGCNIKKKQEIYLFFWLRLLFQVQSCCSRSCVFRFWCEWKRILLRSFSNLWIPTEVKIFVNIFLLPCSLGQEQQLRKYPWNIPGNAQSFKWISFSTCMHKKVCGVALRELLSLEVVWFRLISWHCLNELVDN